MRNQARAFLLFALLLMLAVVSALVYRYAFRGAGLREHMISEEELFRNPSTHPEAVEYEEMVKQLGPAPQDNANLRVGGVLKFLGNSYWQLLARGIGEKSGQLDLRVEIQAAQSESDPEGQRILLEQMTENGKDGFLIAPQAEQNLVEAIRALRRQSIPVVHLSEVGTEMAHHFVGVNHLHTGVLAADYFAERLPDGGEIAIIMGLDNVNAAEHRTSGFIEAAVARNLEVVKVVPGDWSLEKAMNITSSLLDEYPELKGIYCNNDTMALGAIQALKRTGKLEDVIVVGTDGIGAAIDAIQTGELSATIDIHPLETGAIGLEVLVRILHSQEVPPVVFVPQTLITRESVQTDSSESSIP
ncbi:MAG: substrate-binding domain-containing protein [Candidatus Sumerlaeota bacterium]